MIVMMMTMTNFGREEGNHEMTLKTRKKQENDGEPAPPNGNNARRQRRVPERYDILIQCRDEAEQRKLFERLREEGMTLRLLIL